MVALPCYLRQAAEAKCASLPPRGSQQHCRTGGAPQGLLSRGSCANAPSQGHQAIAPYWPCGVSLPRCAFTADSSTMSPQRCFQDYITSGTQGYQEAPVNSAFTLIKLTPTVPFFFELMLIPGSAAQLLNQLVSKPWETGRLSLAGSTYFVMLLLYLTYYNLHQIALCLLKWTIRIQL